MSCCEAEIFDMCIQQNATYARVFTWYGPVVVNGCVVEGPINITGYTGTLQIKAFPLATSILYDASSNLTLGGAAGTISLNIPASVTAGFTWWTGVYDLLLTSADGSYSVRLFQGKVTVSPAVSV